MINLHESMWPDRGSNQQPLDTQSDLLTTALGGPALCFCRFFEGFLCLFDVFFFVLFLSMFFSMLFFCVMSFDVLPYLCYVFSMFCRPMFCHRSSWSSAILNFQDILLTTLKCPNLQRAITPIKIDGICSKVNQVIYSSSPISWPSFKPLAKF